MEVRGDDASGYFGTEAGPDGRILYHKEPIKSTEFVKKVVWQDLVNVDTNMMICHARGASTGVGHPMTNMNNHPFVNSDRTIGLVHNGRIPDFEYDALKKKYKVKSTCDSEILLRIFEASEGKGGSLAEYDDPSEWNLSGRLRSLSNIWSQVVKGHMAVAIGERLNADNRRLFLFHNKYRPLWLIDLREQLGQIFFVSTPEIWQVAADSSESCFWFVRNRVKLIELPIEQIWSFRISDSEPVVVENGIRKFRVDFGNYSTSVYDGDPIPLRSFPIQHEIITRLDENDVPRTFVANDFFAKKKEEVESSGPSQYSESQLALYQPAIPSFEHLIQIAKTHSHLTPSRHVSDVPSYSSEYPREYPINHGYASQLSQVNRDKIDRIQHLANNAEKDIARARRIIRSPDKRISSSPANMEDENTNDHSGLLRKVDSLCKDLSMLADEISTTAHNKNQEGSLSETSFSDLIQSLEQASMDLTGILHILES